jgi:hypothetical protein
MITTDGSLGLLNIAGDLHSNTYTAIKSCRILQFLKFYRVHYNSDLITICICGRNLIQRIFPLFTLLSTPKLPKPQGTNCMDSFHFYFFVLFLCLFLDQSPFIPPNALNTFNTSTTPVIKYCAPDDLLPTVHVQNHFTPYVLLFCISLIN